MRNHFRRLAFILISAIFAVLASGCTKDVRRARHLARADTFFSAQQYDQAEIEYLKVLQVEPLNPTAIRQLGRIYQEEGKSPRAYAFLKKSLELEPENAQAHLQLALTYFALQDRKLAAQEARWVLGKQPGQEQALSLLADSCATLNEIQDARSEIEKLSRDATNKSPHHVALSTLYLKQLDWTNADQELRYALDKEPRSAGTQMALANLYWVRNDLTNADKAFQLAAELSPLRSARRLTYAQFKLRTGAPDAAKQSLQEITSKAPDYLPAWNLLAEIAFAQRNFDECNGFLQRVLARYPSDYNALLLSGNLQLAKGDVAHAIASFEHMSALFDRSAMVQFQLARAYLVNGENGKAILKLNQAISLDPNFADPVLLLATINLRKGQTLEATALLKDLLKRQPQLPQVYLLLANAYLNQKDLDQAVNICRQMETRFPKSPEVPLVLGSVLAKKQQPDEARKAFERALELSPTFLPALEQIVDLDLVDKQYPKAVDRVRREIQNQPQAAELWLLLAKAFLAKAESYLSTTNNQSPGGSPRKVVFADIPAAQPDLTEAEKDLLKSIELNPGLRNSYFMLASLYVASNKQQQALDRLNVFLSKTNDVVARMQVGIIEDRLKNYSSARDAYEKVLAVDPNFSLALNNLAYLYSEHFGDVEKAYQLAEKARRLLPDDPSTADTLGWILFKRGEYSRSAGIIEESASKLPNDPEIQFHLGMAHYMVMEEEPARLALERAQENLKDATLSDEARRRLTILAIDTKTATPATVAKLKSYLHDTPADPIALCRLGDIQQRDGASEEAAKTYQAALECSPQNPQILTKLAELYASGTIKNDKKAFDLAKTAHNLAPDDPRISAVLGRLAFANGDSKWSASLLEESARKLPADPAVSYDLAWAYYSLGRVQDAEAAMRHAQDGTTGVIAESAARFLTFVAAVRDEASAEQISAEAEKTLLADPTYVPALAISARVREHRNDFKAAADLYERILGRYPFFSPAIKNLVVLYAQRLGEDAKAYDLAIKARESSPKDPVIAQILGVLEYRRANYARAAQLLRASSQDGLGNAELFYFLGLAEYHLKAKTESRAALERALALNVQPKFAEDARRILIELK